MFTFKASERELAPSSPMEFQVKDKEVREMFTLKASERELAPSSPMEFSDKFKEVREVFTLNASERELPHHQWSYHANPKT